MISAGDDMAETAGTTFRWDRFTVASALGYCLLVAGLSAGSVLAELREQFGISGFLTALHGSTFGLGLLAVGAAGVAMVDRLGRRESLRLAAMCVVVGIGLFGTGQSWPVTLLGTAFTGFGGALYVMVMPGLINDHHGEHRATAFAAVNGVPGVMGVCISLAIGGALAMEWSWRLPYLALSGVLVGVLAVVARPVAVPVADRSQRFTLTVFRRREVLIPWLFIVNAVLTEFTIGIWSATFMREVGGASSGAAPALAGLFGVSMFASRMVLPSTMRALGTMTIPVSFVVLGVGALMMITGPGLLVRVLGLVVVGLGGGPLYPLTVDRLYHQAGDTLNSTALGAVGAIASGVAITVGPVVLGVLADSVGLRRAMFIVPALAVLGAVTQRPRATVPVTTPA